MLNLDDGYEAKRELVAFKSKYEECQKELVAFKSKCEEREMELASISASKEEFELKNAKLQRKFQDTLNDLTELQQEAMAGKALSSY